MSELLDKLHRILNTAGVKDDEITHGIKLTPRGYEKIAAQLGTSADIVKTMMNSLVTRVRRDEERVSEEARQYTYETDSQGVMVRNSQAGTQKYYTGSSAEHIVRLLSDCKTGSAEEQHLLSLYAPDAQDLTEAESHEEADLGFAEEIKSTSGSFNFPWKVDHRHGTATASYTGRDHHVVIEVIDVRDANGDDAALDAKASNAVHKQALDWAGRV